MERTGSFPPGECERPDPGLSQPGTMFVGRSVLSRDLARVSRFSRFTSLCSFLPESLYNHSTFKYEQPNAAGLELAKVWEGTTDPRRTHSSRRPVKSLDALLEAVLHRARVSPRICNGVSQLRRLSKLFDEPPGAWEPRERYECAEKGNVRRPTHGCARGT